jgi:hypothetical protein
LHLTRAAATAALQLELSAPDLTPYTQGQPCIPPSKTN